MIETHIPMAFFSKVLFFGGVGGGSICHAGLRSHATVVYTPIFMNFPHEPL